MLTVIVLAAVALLSFRRQLWGPATITGTITVEDADPRKQLPIADVEITALNNLAPGPTKSDAAGYFRLILRKNVLPGNPSSCNFAIPGTSVWTWMRRRMAGSMWPGLSRCRKPPLRYPTARPRPSATFVCAIPSKLFAQYMSPAPPRPLKWKTWPTCPARDAHLLA